MLALLYFELQLFAKLLHKILKNILKVAVSVCKKVNNTSFYEVFEVITFKKMTSLS